MILGFKDQFVPYVREGSKTHSVRSGGRWKVGMRADLFEKVRQKGMSLIFRAPVVKVEPVFIWEIRDQHIDGWPRWNLCPLHKRTMIRIGFPENAPLSADELNLFAWRDGFRPEGSTLVEDGAPRPRLYADGCFKLMVKFWAQQHRFGKSVHKFEGQLVYWDYGSRRLS